MNQEVMVSVICLAYNHEKYIKDALEGLIMQKTDFRYEVFVHDDASTDNTAAIIREYAKNYPDIIHPILQTENQYSKKKKISRDIIMPLAKGKYIAVCEADDYWICDNKLQKQVDYMEQCPTCSMCAHAAKIIDYLNNEERLCQPYTYDCDISTETLLEHGGGFLPTASIMYRREHFYLIPKEWTKYNFGDLQQLIHRSLLGTVHYFSDVMSVYRFMVPGSWSERNIKINEKRTKNIEENINLYLLMDKDTNFKYHKVIYQKIKFLKYQAVLLNPSREAIKSYGWCKYLFTYCREKGYRWSLKIKKNVHCFIKND